jgi:hypothetical protein
MFDQKKWQAIEERVGTEVARGGAAENLGPGTDALAQWLTRRTSSRSSGSRRRRCATRRTRSRPARAEFASAEHHAAQS